MRDYEFYYTQDGSIGLYSYADNDVYHSKFGAITEAWEKFIIPSGISKIINTTPNIKVLDVCYGIGYNTKALMSFVINNNENFLKQKNKIFFKKIKNIYSNFLKKTTVTNKNIDSIDNDNIVADAPDLSPSNDSIYREIISTFNIDCLEINEELVKISPLLKTIITPQEIFSRIVPRIFDCFDTYWFIKRFLAKIALKFAPKNKKYISELLELKFNNDYDEIDNEYRIHKFVNYILLDSLVGKYKDDYIDKNFDFLIKSKKVRTFLDQSLIKYAKFKQNKRYNFISKLDLLAFLHNIYYSSCISLIYWILAVLVFYFVY